MSSYLYCSYSIFNKVIDLSHVRAQKVVFSLKSSRVSSHRTMTQEDLLSIQ